MTTARLLSVLAACALAAAGCSSTSTSTSRPTTTQVATPSQQAAALRATSTFRGLMATAGQNLAADVTTLHADAVAGDTTGATSAVTAALLEYDRIRSYADANGGVSTSTGAPIDDQRLLAVLGDLAEGRSVTEQTNQMVESAPLLEVLLSRVILAPATVALRAQDAVAWVAETAPSAYGNSVAPPDETPADCEATVSMAASAYEGLVLLGTSVAPQATARTGAQLAALEASMAGAASPKAVVQAADAAVADLGQLAGQLAGFGRGGEYQ